MVVVGDSGIEDKNGISVTVTRTRKRPVDIIPVNAKTSYPTPLMSPIESLPNANAKTGLLLDNPNSRFTSDDLGDLGIDQGM